MRHIVGLFESRAEAEAAITRLTAFGVDIHAISVAMKDTREAGGPGLAETTGAHDLTEEGTAVGAVSGAAVGALVGLAVAGSTFLLPGVGPLILAGPLVAALTGAGVGAASGGVLGALVGSGIPEPEAVHYLEGVESGRVIVAAQVDDSRAADVRRLLDEEGSHRTHDV